MAIKWVAKPCRDGATQSISTHYHIHRDCARRREAILKIARLGDPLQCLGFAGGGSRKSRQTHPFRSACAARNLGWRVVTAVSYVDRRLAYFAAILAALSISPPLPLSKFAWPGRQFCSVPAGGAIRAYRL
jgi:hypothetical protein